MVPSLVWTIAYTAFTLAALASDTLEGRDYSANSPVVTLKNGSYTGIYSQQYNQEFFLGMPYAQPPARFTLSQPLNSSWVGTRNATSYPPHCIGYGGDDIGYPVSEDCLYLNVIRPAAGGSESGLPVAVWIHGGGLVMGGSADKRYNLSFIVSDSVKLGTPMIAVSLNYRLSAYGFLVGQEAAKAGVTNIGFRDQRLALHWISENIASFGGDPSKITIWGESSGAESVTAHVLAYNGRNDGLFRGAIAQSGFGGYFARNAGGLNATEAMQATYNTLVSNTTCVNSTATLMCLAELPFEEINVALNGTAATPWTPVIDNDFIADFPSVQLRTGRFVKVPLLVGTNTDEGTAFGSGRGPNGTGIDTDAQMIDAVRHMIPSSAVNETGQSIDDLVREILILYPNIQAVGIPSLDKFPVIMASDEVAKANGFQFRRTASLFGDVAIQYIRRQANTAWADHGLPSYSFRFDVTVNGVPDYIAATHFQEVAFVFDNVHGDGYATNPFPNGTTIYTNLAEIMSKAWVNFVTGLDPNGAQEGLGLKDKKPWPVYNITTGGGVGQNVVFTVNGTSYVEADSWRAEGIAWLMDHGLSVLGN